MDPRPVAVLAAYRGGVDDPLALALARSTFEVRNHESFSSALSDIAAASPELILFGDSPDGAHLQFLQSLNDLRRDSLRLFLSDSVDPQRVSQALEAGADDVVAPPHSVGAILMRRIVHTTRRVSPPQSSTRPLRVGDVTVDPVTHEVMGGSDRSFTLSGRELDVLVRLMEARGDVVPRQYLLADIWGDYTSEAVLDTTVHRLRKRLEEEMARPDLVATVRGVGYRLRTG